jgi:hypothetical protein
MSDHYQAVVFQGDSAEAPGRLSNRIHDYLVDAGIIVAEPSDCTLGGPSKSFAPGSNFYAAVAESDEPLYFRTNGVEFREGRLVEITSDSHEVICTICKRLSPVDDEFFEAVSQWYAGDDHSPFACPHCKHSRRLLDWKIEPPCGFGSIIIKFWNWAPLDPEFVVQIGRLAGANLVVVKGSI